MAGYYQLKELGFRLEAGMCLLPRRMVGAMDEANALVEAAKRQAGEIVAEAGQAFVREKARGYDEGRAQAGREAAGRLLAENALLDLRLREIEDELAGIVITCVRKLVHGFGDDEQAAHLVRAALVQMRREKRAELRVAPAQYAFMREGIAGIVADFPEVELVDVVEDPTLSPPQIVLETAIGRVEGDFGRDMEALERIVRESAIAGALADTVAGDGQAGGFPP